MDKLGKALEIAFNAHSGQVDKGGKPYILHPVRVALRCNNEDEKITALLHDVVEDTDITLDFLKENGFGQEVVDAIDCLTKRENEEYPEFIKRISGNRLATAVKINDLTDNMDTERLGGKTHWKTELYGQSLEYLLNSRENL